MPHLTIVVTPKSDMTALSAGAYKKKLLDIIDQKTPDVLIADLTHVNYADSPGIGVLVSLFKRMQTISGSLKLFNVQPRVKAVLDVTGLNRIFSTIGNLPLGLNPKDTIEVNP